MAQDVVHFLEAVEFDQQQRCHRRRALAGAQGLRDTIGQQRPVGQAGEGIVFVVDLQDAGDVAPIGRVEQAVDRSGLGTVRGCDLSRDVVVTGLTVAAHECHRRG